MKNAKIILIILLLLIFILLSGCGKPDKYIEEDDIESYGVDALKKTKDYNGVYTIEYNTVAGNHPFKGVIEISNDNISFNYIDVNSSYSNIESKKGFCGIYERNNTFYIAIDSSSYYIYSCKKKKNDLICETDLSWDLFGYHLYYDDDTHINLIKSDSNFQEITDNLKIEMDQKSVQNQEKYEETKKKIEEYKKQQEINKEKSKYDIEVDAVTISNVYYNNELDGNKKYFGKKIKTSGRFEKAEKGTITGWNVTFNTDGVYDYYCRSFVSGEENHFSEYNRGETIIIYGKVNELVGGYLGLDNCDLERPQ